MTEEILDAYQEVNEKREIHRVLNERQPNLVQKSVLHKGDKIWAFYNPPKKTKQIRQLEATVLKAEENFVLCRRSKNDPAMKVA